MLPATPRIPQQNPSSRHETEFPSGTPWHERSGDHIRYLPRQAAEQLGIPIENWWLFDDAALLLMSYGRSEVPTKSLVTDPKVIAKYQAWRELALSHAVSAETVTV